MGRCGTLSSAKVAAVWAVGVVLFALPWIIDSLVRQFATSPPPAEPWKPSWVDLWLGAVLYVLATGCGAILACRDPLPLVRVRLEPPKAPVSWGAGSPGSWGSAGSAGSAGSWGL